MKAKVLYVIGFFQMFIIGASIGAVFVYFLWPYAIPAMFPGLVESGEIAGDLDFWHSMAVSWIFATLFKSGASGAKKG